MSDSDYVPKPPYHIERQQNGFTLYDGGGQYVGSCKFALWWSTKPEDRKEVLNSIEAQLRRGVQK